jgi:outer membrane lipoprotein LolB
LSAAAGKARRPGGAALARALGGALVLGLLSACASAPPPSAPGEQAFSGRLSVRIAALADQGERAVSLAFDLRGRPQAGQIDFSTPLGSVVAQARWDPGAVRLITPQGERSFNDLDSLSREALGEVVPVAALFDWLQGRPWPGAASQAEAGGMAFSQLGWRVDLARLVEGQVLALRADPPAVTVRVLLDRP